MNAAESAVYSAATNEPVLYVSEIFGSIDGEGITAGGLAVFVRLAGCDLRCAWCDTGYALHRDSGREMSVSEIAAQVERIGYRHVTLTGGEPLLQHNTPLLLERLRSGGYEINIETSGAHDIAPYQKKQTVITMDWKPPSSGMTARMLPENLTRLRSCDVLKLVCQKEDLAWVRHFLREHRLPCFVFLSPVFGAVDPAELVEVLKQLHQDGMDTERMRVQIQLHKVIWDPDRRGV